MRVFYCCLMRWSESHTLEIDLIDVHRARTTREKKNTMDPSTFLASDMCLRNVEFQLQANKLKFEAKKK